MKKVIMNKRGSSLIIIIAVLMLISILGVGFITVSSFNTVTSVGNKNRLQTYYTAKSITESICDATMDDISTSIVELLEQNADDDYQRYLESYNEEVNSYDESINPKNNVYTSNGTKSVDNIDVEVYIEYNFEEDPNKRNATVETIASHKGYTKAVKAYMTKSGVVIEPPPIEDTGSKYTAGIVGTTTLYKDEIKGNVMSSGSIVINNSEVESTNNEYGGDVSSANNIFINQSDVDGNVIAGGAINLVDSDIGKNVMSKSSIIINGSEIDGNISSESIVQIDSSEINGSIHANGDMIISDSNIMGEIISQGNITLVNCRVNGNILANMNIKIDKSRYADSQEITGDNYLDSIIIKCNKDLRINGIAVQKSPTQPPLQVPTAGVSVDITVPKKDILIPDDIEPEHTNTSQLNRTIDTTKGDVYLYINSNNGVHINSGFKIVGDNRVFIILSQNQNENKHNINITVDGEVNKEHADQLFIVSQDKNVSVIMEKNSILNAQIYMPEGTLQIKGNCMINGIVTVGNINSGSHKLEINHMSADYSGTGLEAYFGASGNNGGNTGGGTMIDPGSWGVNQYNGN